MTRAGGRNECCSKFCLEREREKLNYDSIRNFAMCLVGATHYFFFQKNVERSGRVGGWYGYCVGRDARCVHVSLNVLHRHCASRRNNGITRRRRGKKKSTMLSSCEAVLGNTNLIVVFQAERFYSKLLLRLICKVTRGHENSKSTAAKKKAVRSGFFFPRLPPFQSDVFLNVSVICDKCIYCKFACEVWEGKE